MAFGVSLSPEAPTIKSSEKVKFIATVVDPDGAVTYKWYIDDEEQVGETGSTFIFNPESVVGSFSVMVEATDEAPETVDDTEVVTVTSTTPAEVLTESIEALQGAIEALDAKVTLLTTALDNLDVAGFVAGITDFVEGVTDFTAAVEAFSQLDFAAIEEHLEAAKAALEHIKKAV